MLIFCTRNLTTPCSPLFFSSSCTKQVSQIRIKTALAHTWPGNLLFLGAASLHPELSLISQSGTNSPVSMLPTQALELLLVEPFSLSLALSFSLMISKTLKRTCLRCVSTSGACQIYAPIPVKLLHALRATFKSLPQVAQWRRSLLPLRRGLLFAPPPRVLVLA